MTRTRTRTRMRAGSVFMPSPYAAPPTGSPPCGYDPGWALNEAGAAVVRRIFDTYLTGQHSLAEIASKLGGSGGGRLSRTRHTGGRRFERGLPGDRLRRAPGGMGIDGAIRFGPPRSRRHRESETSMVLGTGRSRLRHRTRVCARRLDRTGRLGAQGTPGTWCVMLASARYARHASPSPHVGPRPRARRLWRA